jgi:hypothetical protein
MKPPAARAARALAAVHAAWGTELLLHPDAMLARCHAPGGRGTELVARILGARHVAQAALLRRRPGLGALVDAAHAASMLPLAARRPDVRRAALISAAVSGALGTVGAVIARLER